MPTFEWSSSHWWSLTPKSKVRADPWGAPPNDKMKIESWGPRTQKPTPFHEPPHKSLVSIHAVWTRAVGSLFLTGRIRSLAPSPIARCLLSARFQHVWIAAKWRFVYWLETPCYAYSSSFCCSNELRCGSWNVMPKPASQHPARAAQNRSFAALSTPPLRGRPDDSMSIPWNNFRDADYFQADQCYGKRTWRDKSFNGFEAKLIEPRYSFEVHQWRNAFHWEGSHF